VRHENGLDWAAPGYVIGGLGPILVAALLVPLRDDMVVANLALVLVIVVVLAAAVGGRGAGAVAAIVSVLSFDFFLTKPYLSMQIESADDVETAVLLLVIGLIVGEIVVRARRTRSVAARGAEEIARLHQIAELATSGASGDEVIMAVTDALRDVLALRDCFFERGPSIRPLPRLERNGAVTGTHERRFVSGDLSLPAECELVVLARGRQIGRFVLVADARAGVSMEARTVAVALSDQVGAVVALEDGTAFGRPGVDDV
jgi:K+-sensing histidine kinase KdpD